MTEELIKENCPLLTEVVESLSQPKQLGAEGTRMLTTHVYGLDLNGYCWNIIIGDVKKIFGITIDDDDIRFIIEYADFEARLATTTKAF